MSVVSAQPTLVQSAASDRNEPTPDLLFLCCVRSQGECCCNSVNSFAAVPQENRSFTRDIDRALHMARSLLCGTVSVNGFSKGDIKTPFGGYKMSGSLAGDHGTEALVQYMQAKTI